MHYKTRKIVFEKTYLALTLALPITSTFAYLAAAGEAKRRDSIFISILMMMSSPVMVVTSDLLPSIAINRRLGTSSSVLMLFMAFALIMDQMIRCELSQLICIGSNKYEGCEKISTLFAMTITLLANLSQIALMWPLAKWSLPTPAETAEAAQERGEACSARGRPAGDLIRISAQPNSEVVANCPITSDLPKTPVRFVCPTGDFEDPAGNRVSTKGAFERSEAQKWLNQQTTCPSTRRMVTGLVPAPDVLNRTESTTNAGALEEPLLPAQDDLEAGPAPDVFRRAVASAGSREEPLLPTKCDLEAGYGTFSPR